MHVVGVWSLHDGSAGSVRPARTFLSHTHRLPRRSPSCGFEKHDFFARAGALSCIIILNSMYYSAYCADHRFRSKIMIFEAQQPSGRPTAVRSAPQGRQGHLWDLQTGCRDAPRRLASKNMISSFGPVLGRCKSILVLGRCKSVQVWSIRSEPDRETKN